MASRSIRLRTPLRVVVQARTGGKGKVNDSKRETPFGTTAEVHPGLVTAPRQVEPGWVRAWS